MEDSWLSGVELKIIFFILYIVVVGTAISENCMTGFKSYIIVGPFIFPKAECKVSYVILIININNGSF